MLYYNIYLKDIDVSNHNPIYSTVKSAGGVQTQRP